jgi:hypothetical protein
VEVVEHIQDLVVEVQQELLEQLIVAQEAVDLELEAQVIILEVQVALEQLSSHTLAHNNLQAEL